MMSQDEMKQAVARAAIEYVPADCIVGVGTGSTANFFIDELAKIKHKIRVRSRVPRLRPSACRVTASRCCR